MKDQLVSFCGKRVPTWFQLLGQQELCCLRDVGHDGQCMLHLRDVTLSWPNPVQAFGADRDLARPLPVWEGLAHGQ